MKLKLGAWSVFLIGYGLGVLTSYNFFKDKYEKKAEADAKSVREHLEHLYGVDKGEEKEKEDETPKDQTMEVRSSLNDKKERHEYEGKYHYKVEDPADREFPREDVRDEDSDEVIETDIDEYISNTKYGKMPLTWFTEDSVLIRTEYNENDGEEELVDDECNYLGNVLTTSGFKMNEAPCIYVKNPKTQTIYEVTKCYGRYRG